jgi:EmrB/QacA subfamily drug resistance transporter
VRAPRFRRGRLSLPSTGPADPAAQDGDGLALDSAQGRWTLLATVAGSGMAFLDSTVVTVALPRIGTDLGAGLGGLQWVLNGYLVALSALILLGGSLGDRFGRRRAFTAGVVVFTAASAACAAAPSVGVLVGARVVQGVGGALLTPGSLAILEASFRRDDRARAIGAWSGLTGVAAAVGPFLGGWLVDAGSWRWIFLINLPIAAAVIAVSTRHVPESSDPHSPRRVDVPGALAVALGLGAASWGLIAAGDRGWGAPAVWGSLVAGAAGLAVFVVIELRGSDPMVPLGIFTVRQFTAANLVTVTVYAALGGVFFLLVLQLQQVLGYSALEAGAASLPITFVMLALSSRSGALAHRIGPRLQMSAGPLILAAGVLLVARIDAGDSYLTAVLPAVLVMGLGLAATVAPLTATALGALDDRHAGIASGVNTTVARAAQLAAVAALPVLAGITGDAYRDPAVFSDGFRTAMLVTAALAVVGGASGFALVRNPVPATPAVARGVAEAEPVMEERDVMAGRGAGRAGDRTEDWFCGVEGPPLERCPRPVDLPSD